MRAMLPRARQTLKLLRAGARRVAELRRVLAWGLGVWLATVGVPFAFLYPDEGLDRPIIWALAALAPLGLLLAAPSGGAFAVLGAGLCGLLPVLIAAPELQGPRTAGTVQGLLVAIVVLGFVAAAWDHSVGARAGAARLGRLLAGLRTGTHWIYWVLAALWLGQAWWVVDLPPAEVEGARAARVAGAALCWLAVRLLPLRGPLPERDPAGARDPWALYVGRRVAWLALFGGLWWLWGRAG